MKTRILYLLGMFMMVSTVEASLNNEQQHSKMDYASFDEEPIFFKERGIKFYIFLNGEMDFDIHANDRGNTTEYYYRSSKNESRNNRLHRKGTKVIRDYRGKVIRVGSVFINYNYRGKISRVGSVFIRYRRNFMTRVGGLQIRYDRYGNIRYTGRVKHRYTTGYYSNYYNNLVYDYNDGFFTDGYEQSEEDDYYYRTKGKATHQRNNRSSNKKQQVIKRKKNPSNK